MVIYQIYPRSFRDTDGDGVGDLNGVAEGLDYVASLGVDAVWLSPFYASPMADFGYDVSDWRAVDPLFGSMADFERVAEGCRRLGLKLIIDMVWSHSSDRHAWFQESRSSRGNARADWYVWADARPDGTPPNNWLSVFGGGAWSWEPRRRQYYLHHFLPCQPALNWRNPDVAAAMLEVGRFWRDKGADGFRLDAIDFLMHDEALRDNPPRPLAEVPAKPFGMQQHLYDMVRPETLEVLEAIRAAFPDMVTVGELSSVGDPLARAGDYTRPGRLTLAYSLGLMRRPFTAATLRHTIAEAEAKLPGGSFCWAASNHDMERAASRWGDGSPASAKGILALMLALRGGLCLYQGEELGLTEALIPFDRLRDPYGIAFWPDYKGRDGCRTPLPWTAAQADDGWLPLPPEHRALAVEEQERDGDSVLNTLRRLLRWRKLHPDLTEGGLEMVELHPALVAFRRGAVLVAANPSPAAIALPLPEGRRPAEGVGYGVEGDMLRLEGWGVAYLA